MWTGLLKMALGWTSKSNSSCFPGREHVRTWKGRLPDRKHKALWRAVSPAVLSRGYRQSTWTYRKPTPGNLLSGSLLSSLACTSPCWHHSAQTVLVRRCPGPPSQSLPSVPVCSRTTACPFGLACLFHMCCPGQFPSSVKSFSSRHKSNTGNKHTGQNPHSFSSWICVGWE